MFKQSLNQSSGSELLVQTPALGRDNKFRNSPSPPSKEHSKSNIIGIRDQEDDEDAIEESEEAYQDDDFESSEGSAALAKVTVSASGKLPPLSGSYPYGADEKSLSQSFKDNSTKGIS